MATKSPKWAAKPVKITKAALRSLKYSHAPDAPSTQIYWDTELSNFGVRCYPSGKRSFVIGYRVNGKYLRTSIGSVNEYAAPIQAREVARDKLAGVRSGLDPKTGRKIDPDTGKAKQTHDATVANIITYYLDQLRRPAKSDRSVNEARSMFDRFALPKLGRKLATSVTPADIQRIHAEITDSGAAYQANRFVQAIKAAYNMAINAELIPYDHRNPAKTAGRHGSNGIRMNPEKKRTRYIQPGEMKALAKAINKEESIYIRSALWFLILTGCRKSEVLGAKWEQVDIENGTLFLPDPKNREPRFVRLSSPAVTLLKDLPRDEGNEYVFRGHIHGRPLVNITKPWDRIRKAAGVPDLRLHDLRRTVGSWAVNSGATLHQAGGMLGHKSSETTKRHYAHLADEKLKELAESHAKQVLGAAGLRKGARVTRIRVEK